MALDTPPTTNGAQRGSTSLSGGRGRPQMVTQRRTTALAPILEGIALASEVERSATYMQTLAALGSRQLLVEEAGRLGTRATAARAELRAMAALVEKP